MSVKKEKSINIKISAKGILKDITEDGFVIEDIKEGTEDVVLFSEIRSLLDKEITIAIANKEAEEE